jgi:DNA-binding NtrC family response regulator
MTAWTALETAVTLTKEGAADYIAKPWDDDKLVRTVRNLVQLRALRQENTRLRAQGNRARRSLAEKHDLREVIYASPQMHEVVRLAVSIAPSDVPVLITGPNGSGKEKLAEIIQANSRRRDKPFVRVNVGALPENLFEAELFGAEAGAFTGATKLRVGRFEAADGGTLFLDELGTLPLVAQAKLLRVLQTGDFERLGSSTTRKANVRLRVETGRRMTPLGLGPLAGEVGAAATPLGGPARAAANDSASDEERAGIEDALLRAGGVVAKAAAEMGMSRQSLYQRMERLGIVMERRPR